MQVDLSGKVALVTGAGRGIGRGIATLLAANGAQVLVATRTAETGAAVVAEITAAGGAARLATLDISTRAACDAAVAAAVEAFGKLDIVVHNAAAVAFTPFPELTDDEFDVVLRTNLHALMWLARAALPHVGRTGAGRLIAISSLIGNHSWLAGLDAYAASKAGINGLAGNLALEFAKCGATVNVIEPGLIIDDRDPRMDEATRDMIVPNIPLQRAGLPADIANAVLFFASPTSQFVTGQALVVDGGHRLPDMSSRAMAGRL